MKYPVHAWEMSHIFTGFLFFASMNGEKSGYFLALPYFQTHILLERCTLFSQGFTIIIFRVVDFNLNDMLRPRKVHDGRIAPPLLLAIKARCSCFGFLCYS
jgi:hypothetical protein